MWPAFALAAMLLAEPGDEVLATLGKRQPIACRLSGLVEGPDLDAFDDAVVPELTAVAADLEKSVGPLLQACIKDHELASAPKCRALSAKVKHLEALLVHSSGKRVAVDQLMSDDCCNRHDLVIFEIPSGRVLGFMHWGEGPPELPGVTAAVREAFIRNGYQAAEAFKGPPPRALVKLADEGPVLSRADIAGGSAWLFQHVWQHPLEGNMNEGLVCVIQAGKGRCFPPFHLFAIAGVRYQLDRFLERRARDGGG